MHPRSAYFGPPSYPVVTDSTLPVPGLSPSALGNNFRCHGVRAERAEALHDAVQAAFSADRPTLIEFRQDSPWLKT